MLRSIIVSCFLKQQRVRKKLKALIFTMIYGHSFSSIGKNFKLYIKPYGTPTIKKINNLRVGDNCWVETVYRYGNDDFNPVLLIGENVAMSDFVHISCAYKIEIGKGVLIGSKVYIGDHSHGEYKGKSYQNDAPANRPLGDFGEIIISDNCWIGDNAVILGGSEIGEGCIIAANSVVRNLKVTQPSLIGGIPAKVIKTL
ncbi:transferase [Kosakonia oryzae]|nr:transferase [Kosakonia oryzae]